MLWKTPPSATEYLLAAGLLYTVSGGHLPMPELVAQIDLLQFFERAVLRPFYWGYLHHVVHT